jgi:putative colanic acid biosynthesis UDP-glucose lipid carrier transferase
MHRDVAQRPAAAATWCLNCVNNRDGTHIALFAMRQRNAQSLEWSSAMSDTPAGIGRLPRNREQLRAARSDRPASDLLCNGSLQNKAVRFGSLEAAHVTLARQIILPLVVVFALALCVLVCGQSLSLQFCALGLVTFLITAQIFSPLDLDSRQSTTRPSRVVSRILLEWSCVVAVLVFLSVSLKLTQIYSRDIVASWFLVTPVALLLVESLRNPVARWLASERSTVQRYIIIGANDVGTELARRIEHGHAGEKFFGFLDYRSAERAAADLNQSVTGNCSARDFADFVRTHAIGRVYLALPISKAPRIEELLKELRDTTASVYFVPNIFAFDLVQARCVEINGMPAFSICDSPLQGMSGFWKRVFDVALASIALGLLLPLLLTVALAIKRSSSGPILFKQRRYGLNGEEIVIYKFRSMTVSEDGPVVAQATEKDPRITPLGAFLRRTSLDELPQILNVLEGKMSFVGPRPHAVAHNEEYRKLINGYMIRHKVRPGITGWAQINGLRGETPTVDKMHRRVQYDLDYLKNWSLWLDLKIIARTALIVLNDRNAY